MAFEYVTHIWQIVTKTYEHDLQAPLRQLGMLAFHLPSAVQYKLFSPTSE